MLQQSVLQSKVLLRHIFIFFGFLLIQGVRGQSSEVSDYKLWLDFKPVRNPELLMEYRQAIGKMQMQPKGETQEIIWSELKHGLEALLSKPIAGDASKTKENILLVSLFADLPPEIQKQLGPKKIPENGFLIEQLTVQKQQILVLTASEDFGLLYGAFRLLRLLQTEQPLAKITLLDAPKTKLRMLNHWDNLDRTVERGYAGASIWDWQRLPGYIDPRYRDYARANASLGINATVVTNVNANALVLSEMYIAKAAALANVFRPYGIKLFLTARFSAPMELGGLATADPLNPEVKAWWEQKVSEIYKQIPDFGGFVVKANSEGQPGPQNFGRTHLDGANMMAEALMPYGGWLIWRAFVYSEHDPTDRAKQAYDEFLPYDGKFRDNVVIQVKNGPIDFQPREPIHPIFGAMKHTPILAEFQITKEYLGFASHIAFLPKLFEEVLQTDTGQQGLGSTVARVVDGSLYNLEVGGMAGVSNIGTALNWTGHPFGQADWYGFGRLTWNPDLSAEVLAEEWIRSTLGNDPVLIQKVKGILLASREAVVQYMMPLGLHHLFDTGHHYGPGPWVSNLSRPEWNPVYYHQADSLGIGFNRTATGSNAVGQYAPSLANVYANPETCPDEFLLWFHHLPWDYVMKNGTTLWEAMGLKYQEGVNQVRQMRSIWEGLDQLVPAELYWEVLELLNIQLVEAIWWKDACMSYFQTFSKREFPEGMEPPKHNLSFYKSLKFPYAPGTRPSWN
ncbi:MAG: hypothetical protein RLZZ241_1747 [Bacteroidota bacterium]|jgi:alpha-glucuronidase